jgi:uncharacterized damage-inducible protein DinB
MSEVSKNFLDLSRDMLTKQLFPRIEKCVEKIPDERIWWRPNDDSNSIGNLVLHLSGNVGQWIVSGIGGEPDKRHRQQEFDARGEITSAQLLDKLRKTVEEADAAIAKVKPENLLERRTIQNNDVTVLEAIYHVMEHFAMHCGQIIFIAKSLEGDMGFYDLSSGTPRPTWAKKEA